MIWYNKDEKVIIMSSFEYNDLFLKCQDTGKYHMFVFDIAGSTKMSNHERLIAQYKMLELMNKIYKTIEEIQETTNRKILVFEEDFVTYKSSKNNKQFGLKIEPFLLHDTFGFTIYRDSLDRDVVYYIYEYLKKSLEIDFDFHAADGFYETNDFGEGNKKYFRGYCLDLLSRLHKKETIEELEKIKKNI